jgi:fatty-acid desaturase
MPNIKNLRLGAKGLSKRQIINFFIYIVVFLLIIGGFLFYQRSHKKHHIAAETRTAPLTKQYLSTKDYNSYQLQLSSAADDYTSMKRYNDAQRVLNEIIANVPSDKIMSDSYRSFWYLYQQNGDTVNRKKYAKLTADKLKQEGQIKAAAAFEADANGK